jgi:hypothetical protein
VNCGGVQFSGHAVRKMFERRLSRDTVLTVIATGEIVIDYPNDRPYPSALVPGFPDGQAVHAVVARNPTSRQCTVVTAYRPDPTLWEDNFRTRRR